MNRTAAPQQTIVTLDLEGVLVPEIWIAVAERTGLPELRRTTRDEPDYDKLMRFRLDLLERRRLGLPDIQDVIGGMGPMPGAKDFLDQLRQDFQVIILSDTFYEFAMPLMNQLNMPALFCHKLEADADGMLVNYHLRMASSTAPPISSCRKCGRHRQCAVRNEVGRGHDDFRFGIENRAEQHMRHIG